MPRLLEYLANAFPVWVAAACGLALLEPDLFTWFKPFLSWGLAVVMLGMGMTLAPADFARVTSRPGAVIAGFFAQFLIMPTAGWSVATLMELPTPFAVGVILVGCCPGGTASNVVTYIAKADVALSVTMTTCSTLAAVILTPLLTRVLAGHLVDVDSLKLLLDTFQVVVAPVAIGIVLNRYAAGLVKRVTPVAPLVSVLAVALICGCIIGLNAADVRASGATLLASVVLLHVIGFGVGYAFARMFRLSPIVARTISIETGMQNSGLGAVLAKNNFPTEPLTAVPCAISAVVHSVVGSLLAGIWRLFPASAPREPG